MFKFIHFKKNIQNSTYHKEEKFDIPNKSVTKVYIYEAINTDNPAMKDTHTTRRGNLPILTFLQGQWATLVGDLNALKLLVLSATSFHYY